jgi:hypothetical protein
MIAADPLTDGGGMTDIGVAPYRRTAPGRLEASWYTSRLGQRVAGTGTAMGEGAGDYCGQYQVTYVYSDGQVAGTCGLTIERNGVAYDLSWRREGRVTHQGVGIETPDGLAVGWRHFG